LEDAEQNRLSQTLPERATVKFVQRTQRSLWTSFYVRRGEGRSSSLTSVKCLRIEADLRFHLQAFSRAFFLGTASSSAQSVDR